MRQRLRSIGESKPSPRPVEPRSTDKGHGVKPPDVATAIGQTASGMTRFSILQGKAGAPLAERYLHSELEGNAPVTARANCPPHAVRFKAGYGMCFVPSSPGSYDLDCVTWRPQGTLADRLSGEIIIQ